MQGAGCDFSLISAGSSRLALEHEWKRKAVQFICKSASFGSGLVTNTVKCSLRPLHNRPHKPLKTEVLWGCLLKLVYVKSGLLSFEWLS